MIEKIKRYAKHASLVCLLVGSVYAQTPELQYHPRNQLPAKQTAQIKQGKQDNSFLEQKSMPQLAQYVVDHSDQHCAASDSVYTIMRNYVYDSCRRHVNDANTFIYNGLYLLAYSQRSPDLSNLEFMLHFAPFKTKLQAVLKDTISWKHQFRTNDSLTDMFIEKTTNTILDNPMNANALFEKLYTGMSEKNSFSFENKKHFFEYIVRSIKKNPELIKAIYDETKKGDD